MATIRRTMVRLALVLACGLASATALAQQEIVEYVELDAVGNILVVTDANGNVVEEHDYDPYGQELCGTPPNMVPCATMPAGQSRRFTGKERDKETGLDYFGARYYQGNVGRFTSVDPVMDIKTALRDPQKWNRYAYSRNNPLKFVDPDGQDEVTAIMGASLFQSRLTPQQQTLAQFGQRASDAGTLAGGAVLMSAAGAAMAPAIATEIGIAARGCMASAGCQGALRGLAEDFSGSAPGSMGSMALSGTVRPLARSLGAAGDDFLLRKAVNSKLPHAASRAFEHGVFGSVDEASAALRELSAGITRSGAFPAGTLVDTARSSRFLVPVGEGGLAVYHLGGNGTARLKTVLKARQ